MSDEILRLIDCAIKGDNPEIVASQIRAALRTATTEPSDAAVETCELDPPLTDQQRQYLEDILAGGEQARPNLYGLFDAGRRVRKVADNMYWAVRGDDPNAFKAAMAEYEQVVGLNFTVPDVQLKPFAALRSGSGETGEAALSRQPVEADGEGWQFLRQTVTPPPFWHNEQAWRVMWRMVSEHAARLSTTANPKGDAHG